MKKTVFLTGADGGLGRAIGKLFEKEGYRVVAICRSAEADVPWPVVPMDLSDVHSIGSALETAMKEHGIPDVLVNNAGIYRVEPWDEQGVDGWQLTMRVNVDAPFVLSQGVGRALVAEKRSGAIVNISSVSGFMGSGDPAYAASKAALVGLTRSFSRSLAQYNIRVNAIAPGPVDTPMAAKIPAKRRKMYEESIPMGRFSTPEEVAQAALYLARDATCTTGSTLAVDGGWM